MPGIRSLLIALLLSLALVFAWLISTTDGARWAAHRASDWLAGFQVSVASGSLWQGGQLSDLQWQGEALTLHAREIEFAWDPACLWRWRICLGPVDITDLDVYLPSAHSTSSSTSPSPSPSPTPSLTSALTSIIDSGRDRAWALSLPSVSLPFGLTLDALSIDRLAIQRGELAAQVDHLNLGLAFEQGELQASPWRVEATALAGDNRVDIRAQQDASGELAFNLAVDAPALSRFWPGLEGQAAGSIEALWAAAEFSFAADLRLDDIAYQNVRVGQALIAADWDMSSGGETLMTLANVHAAGQRFGDARLAISGRLDQHKISVELPNIPVPVTLQLVGGLDQAMTQWQGSLADAVLGPPTMRWQLLGTPDVTVGFAAPAVELAPHCWTHQALSLCTEPLVADRQSARLGLSLPSMPLDVLARYWPEGLELSGDITGTASLSWQAGSAPQGRVTLVSPGGVVRLTAPGDESALPLRYRRVVVDADLRPDRADLRFGIASPDIGNGGFALQTDPLDVTRPMSGIVWLEGLSVAPLAGLLPQISQIEGVMAARGELAGTLAAPRFIGDLTLADARVLPRALAAPLEAVNVTARVDGRAARINGGFTLGAGQGEISGDLALESDGLRGQLALSGQGLELKPGAVTELVVNPELSLSFAADRLALGGTVEVPSARIVLEGGAGSGATRVSADTVQVDASGEPLAGSAPTGSQARLESDVRLVLGQDVQLQVRGLSARLTGELALQQQGDAEVQAEGVLELADAQFNAYGQSLDVRRGRLIFAGPLVNPRLDLEAVREAPELLAGLRVSGSAEDPQLTLFSRPPLEQASILSYLITGRPPGQGAPSEEALVSEAALSLGVFGGGRIGGALAEELGIENFQLEASGQGDSAQVAVSGYLAPNLLLRYGVGVFEPEDTLTLRYYLRPQLYLEAVSGAEAAIDVFYSFDYD